MGEIQRITAKELAHKIAATAGEPRFAFFLGAGASRQSEIITAGEMIDHFKERIAEACCPPEIESLEKRLEWFERQAWYKKCGDDYSTLFEKFEPKEIGRQRYIESIIGDREPSIGYMVLALLIANHYVSTVITTNFDDLAFKACTSYTRTRPIVYAYGVGASELRISANRPMLIKLHGDYLYSSLKNTDRELSSQDPNMARQVSQILRQYGLIVLGYSGGDKSVMKILSEISELNDLYWCVKTGATLNKETLDLLSKKRGIIVEIDGFDEAMSEIGVIVGLDPSALTNVMFQRQSEVVEKVKSYASEGKYSRTNMYSRKILSKMVDNLKEQLEQHAAEVRKVNALTTFLDANEAGINGDHKKAARLYREVIKLTPDDANAHNNLGYALYQLDPAGNQALREYEEAMSLAPYNPSAFLNAAWLHHDRRQFDEAIELLLRVAVIQPSEVVYNGLGYSYLWKGRLNEAYEEFKKARHASPTDGNIVLNMGLVRLLQGRVKDAQKLWKRALELTSSDSLNQVTLKLALGRTKEAFADLTELIARGNQNRVSLKGLLDDASLMRRARSRPKDLDRLIAYLRRELKASKGRQDKDGRPPRRRVPRSKAAARGRSRRLSRRVKVSRA